MFLWQNKTYLLIDTYHQIYGTFLLTGDFNAEDIQPCLSQFLFEYDTTNLIMEKPVSEANVNPVVLTFLSQILLEFSKYINNDNKGV